MWCGAHPNGLDPHHDAMALSALGAGAWMFARVTGDGRTVRLERADDGRTHDEVAERSYPWRPRWSALLPTDRL